MIHIGAFFGLDFNNNGDLGNLQVLARALLTDGNRVRVSEVLSTQKDLVEVDFLVVGDASRAHQRALANEFLWLPDVIKERQNQRKWTLVVGSSYEALAESVFQLTVASRSERLSDFVVTEIQSSLFWGYVNTEVDVPALMIQDTTIGTLLYGPFLARNPAAIHMLAAANSWRVDENYIESLTELMQQSPNFKNAIRRNS